MFIALEVFSLPLYLMCGLARRRRLLSQEAALKYFLLGAFSSAFFLYGIALLYGFAGTLSLTGIATALADGVGQYVAGAHRDRPDSRSGVLFKVGAVPFHSWIPDVYQGAPTPVTAFMAAATKIAAFGAMLRIFYVALPGMADAWRPVLWAIAILTMTSARSRQCPRPTSSGCWPTRRSRTPASSSTGVIALNDNGSVGDAVLSVRLRFQHSRRVRGRQRGPQCGR